MNNGNGNGRTHIMDPIAQQFDKLIPQDPEAEMCFLGSLMLDAFIRAECIGLVGRGDFLDSANQAIYDAVAGLDAAGKSIDAITTRAKMLSRGTFEEAGGMEYLAAILNKVHSAAHGAQYGAIVLANAKRRRLIEAANAILRDAYCATEEVENVIERSAQRMAGIGTGEGAGSLEPIRADRLIADFPEQAEVLVSNVIRAGDVGAINASSKSQKSFLVNDLVISFAAGIPWLGLFQTFKGRTLLVDNECKPGTIGHRLPRVAAARGLDHTDWRHNLDVLSLRGRLMDLKQFRAKILSRFKPGQYRLIVLDAAYRFFWRGFEENSNADWTEFFNVLDGEAARLDCAFVLIHHASKGNQSAKETTDVGSGAGAIARASDFHIALRPHEEPP